MCGIVGVLSSTPSDLERTVTMMNNVLVHRGPDEGGIASLPNDGVALAMRRLSILDIAGGRQPMWDESRGHVVVFNGEIYNFVQLRDALIAKGHTFASHHSDTEVVVHGFEEWGTNLFPRLNGMFAIAIWSRAQRRLFLARDRFGEKPLYVAKTSDGFAFASELKALFQHPDVCRDVDPVALDQYLSLGYVVGPRTMLRRVSKLEAGNYAILTTESLTSRPYWRMTFDPTTTAREEDLTERLDGLLSAAVRDRMVADVPVGVFLSGGLDSSTVAYYMRQHSDDVHSFSIGFEDPTFDESRYAEMAARRLGTTHHREVFSDDRVLGLVPRIAEVLDEPMPDSSILPTYLLCRFARTGVRVALGGDGSDELLMGYRTYQLLKLAWEAERLPLAVRKAMAAAARRMPVMFGPIPLKGRNLAIRMDKPAPERLLGMLSSFGGDARWILSADIRRQLPASVFDGLDQALRTPANGMGPAEATVAAYARGYLQEDILVKVDRASMATSLEVRSPFLDRDLADFLASVPASLKLRGMTGKYLLRRLMRGRLPDEILDRRKMGFGVPISRWLRTSLAPLVSEYLDPGRIADAGLFDPAAVATLLGKQANGPDHTGQQLWFLLIFEMWRERWLRPTHVA